MPAQSSKASDSILAVDIEDWADASDDEYASEDEDDDDDDVVDDDDENKEEEEAIPPALNLDAKGTTASLSIADRTSAMSSLSLKEQSNILIAIYYYYFVVVVVVVVVAATEISSFYEGTI